MAAANVTGVFGGLVRLAGLPRQRHHQKASGRYQRSHCSIEQPLSKSSRVSSLVQGNWNFLHCSWLCQNAAVGEKQMTTECKKKAKMPKKRLKNHPRVCVQKRKPLLEKPWKRSSVQLHFPLILHNSVESLRSCWAVGSTNVWPSDTGSLHWLHTRIRVHTHTHTHTHTKLLGGLLTSRISYWSTTVTVRLPARNPAQGVRVLTLMSHS